MLKNRSKILFVLLLVTLLPFSSVISASFVGPAAAGAVSRTTTGFSDDFTTTANQDGGATTADGWGSGTVTSARTSQLQLLDYVATTNSVRSVDVQGRKAYFCTYTAPDNLNALHIFDLTDPSNLNNLTYRYWPNLPCDLVVDGDLMFVGSDMDSDGDGDLFIYNVSDTSIAPIPFISGVWDITGLPVGLAKQGHFLYVAAFDSSAGRFMIYDVEDPTNIIEASSWGWTRVLDFVVEGQIAYGAHGTYGLKTVNVSSPYNIPFTFMDTVNTPGNATSVLVDGGIAYVADGPSGVQVVDVSNPYSISIIGSCNTPGNAEKLALQGDTLFVADRSGGVRVIDVSDPTNPTNLTSVSPADVFDVALYGSVLVVAASDGVYTYQYGSFTDLSVVGTFDDYEVWDVRVRGDIAYVAAGPDGFLTVNVSDPTTPVLLDQYSVGTKMCKLDIQGHHAYVIDYTGGTVIYIFDISDPTNIQLIPSSMGAGNLIDFFAWGEVLFFTFEGGWGALNISNPYAITIIHNTFFGTNITACWVQGYHIYLVEDLGGLGPGFHVIDTLNIASPSVVSSESLTSYHYDVYVDGDVGFAANNQSATVWNVTDPYNPDDTDSTSSSNPAMGVWGFGPYMISLRKGDGVQIHDTHNINDIRIISSCSGMAGALQVTAHGDYIYVANRTSLEILRFFDSRSSFTSLSTAQSIAIDTTTDPITNATLSATTLTLYGTGLSYFLSADGGAHWEAVTLGVSHTFVNPGSDLRFQVNFTTSRGDRSARLFDVTINYSHTPLLAPFPFAAVIAVIAIIIVILIILLLYFLWYKKKEK